MPLRSLLSSELPYLRRYARCVTGSQQLGDAAVREMLEALLEAPGEFDMAAPVRVELYRIFHRLWHPAALAGQEHRPTSVLDLTERAALMLTAVEGFSTAETAVILREDVARVSEAVAFARDVIAKCLSARIMVIEDEPIVAMHIQQVVEDMGHSVCGIAATKDEAVALARDLAPELVLADINLADGSSGINAVQEILAELSTPVVFVTAFPERLLSGEHPEPTYLVSKPFDEQALLSTIGQAILFHREQLDMAGSAAGWNGRVAARP